MGFTDQEPHRHQRQRHVVMPPLPGADLILVHADLAFASFEARFNAGARFDDPCQFPKRRFLERPLRLTGRCEVILVAMLGVLIGGIPRGAGLQGTVVSYKRSCDSLNRKSMSCGNVLQKSLRLSTRVSATGLYFHKS